MAQSRWRKALLAVAGGALLALSGCSAARSNTQVRDEWLARVPEEQLGGVREAQATRRQAIDGIMRAEVEVRDAERALEVARREAAAAGMRKEAEKASLEAAEAQGQRALIEQARGSLRAAEVAEEVAKAQVAWREEVVDTRKAQKQIREREAEVASAELSRAEFLALKQSGDVRADELSEGGFNAAVADAQKRLAEAQERLESRQREEQQARARWEGLRNQGYGGSGPQQ